VTKPDVDAALEVVEEVDAFANERHLILIVELQTKGAGGDRRGQCGQGRSFFEDDGVEPGTLREECGGAADDAAANNDEVGGIGR
jgi:hypothetical protein